jgi:hypothetical protein
MPLDVAAGATHLTCSFCVTDLAVDHAGGRPALRVATPTTDARAALLAEAREVHAALEGINAEMLLLPDGALSREQTAQMNALLARGDALVTRRNDLRAALNPLPDALAPPPAPPAQRRGWFGRRRG